MGVIGRAAMLLLKILVVALYLPVLVGARM
jgi:hypothetical protein